MQPISYGPDKMLIAVWALVASPPAVIWFLVLFRSPSAANALPLLIALMLPLAAIAFASRFRATFTPTEFVYRRWGPTIRVPYAEIDRIEVANVTPVSKQPIGAFVVTKRGERLPFWPKLFPKDAVKRFFAMGR